MKLYLAKEWIEFNPAGGFDRLGDYFSGERDQTPFSLFCEEAGAFSAPEISGRGCEKKLFWSDSKGTLTIASKLVFDPETNVIARCDSLKNTGKKPLIIRRYFARFLFGRGEYELYSQPSRWRRECVGAWTKLTGGRIELCSREGRWCEGVAPYAVLRDAYSTHALAFMVSPEGDWLLRFSMETEAGMLNDMTVEAGLSDDRLALELAPAKRGTPPRSLSRYCRLANRHPELL